MKDKIGFAVAFLGGMSSVLLPIIKGGNEYASYGAVLVFIGIGVLVFSKVTQFKDETVLPFEERVSILKKHEIFFNLKKWVDFDINRITITNKKREWNIKLILKVKFKLFYEALNQEIEKFRERKTICDYNYWHDFLYNTNAEFLKTTLKMGNNEKFVEIFEEYRQKSELNTAESLREILNNPLYDNVEKLSAILDRFLWDFRETHNDVYKIIKMNGRLDSALESWKIPKGA